MWDACTSIRAMATGSGYDAATKRETDMPNIGGSRVFISVAEESADVHAAALVRMARERLPGVTFYGLTGPRLRELGVTTVYDFAAHAAMLGGVFGVLGQAWRAVQVVERSWRQNRPDLVVLIDSPELHLGVPELGLVGLAGRAKRRGIPVLYYIAPQTWAARPWRRRWIFRDIDRLACILPFEETHFRGTGAFRATYVGHPLFETLSHERPLPDTVNFLKQRAGGRPMVALLPGSRHHVIEAMLPRQLEVIRRLRAAERDIYAAISCVSPAHREQVRTILQQGATALEQCSLVRSATADLLAPGPVNVGRGGPTLPESTADLGIDLVVADNASLLAAADLVLVTSGTATLHAAYYRKPMIVMYDAGRLMSGLYRFLGRLIIDTPHLSLVNILAGARVVPEFMPSVPDLGAVAAVAGQLLTDATWRNLMVRQIDAVVRPLENSTASANVCRLMAEMLQAARRPAAADCPPGQPR
jgi:lipid-A-disaccharide synthase